MEDGTRPTPTAKHAALSMPRYLRYATVAYLPPPLTAWGDQFCGVDSTYTQPEPQVAWRPLANSDMRLWIDAISLWRLSRKIYRTSLVKNGQMHVDKDAAAWPPADKVDRELSVQFGDQCIYLSFWASYSPGQHQWPSRLERYNGSSYSS